MITRREALRNVSAAMSAVVLPLNLIANDFMENYGEAAVKDEPLTVENLHAIQVKMLPARNEKPESVNYLKYDPDLVAELRKNNIDTTAKLISVINENLEYALEYDSKTAKDYFRRSRLSKWHHLATESDEYYFNHAGLIRNMMRNHLRNQIKNQKSFRAI